ncbi:MAG: YdeI/OmpD-associated family protein [Bacteroidota bacterium]
MPKIDERVYAYIAKAQPFAQPILIHLRKLIHKACPDVQETIKWGFASFDYKGPMVSIAAFKQHCAFGFWKHSLIKDPEGFIQERSNNGGEAMGNFGRITSIKDLPADKIIIDYIKQAMKLNEEGIKLPPKVKTTEKTEIEMPDYFLASLKENDLAMKTFEGFSPSHKREYLEWITEAKMEETRKKRMATTIEWLTEGKPRNWKYKK